MFGARRVFLYRRNGEKVGDLAVEYVARSGDRPQPGKAQLAFRSPTPLGALGVLSVYIRQTG